MFAISVLPVLITIWHLSSFLVWYFMARLKTHSARSASSIQQARQRAFTVTGPYGTGKSTIALLLAGCLHDDKQVRTGAKARLGKAFDKEFGCYFKVDKGWLTIRAVGGIGHPVGSMWQAVIKALSEHPGTSKLAKKYDQPSATPSSDEFYAFMQVMLKDVKGKVDGVLFMLDEMGKTVEHFIRDDNNTLKVQFFQNFAELFSEVPGLFVGFLHQAFSEYAQSRGKSIQDEWAKIQGRYTDLLYNVSEDETVALIAQSIEAQFELLDDSAQYHSKLVGDVCKTLQRAKLRSNEILQRRLLDCFPLHPTVALLLGPISKRRFSQNERSTFSFLNSREPHSFHSFLEEHDDNENVSYRLYNLWDYLESNLEHHIIGTKDGHAWSVASDAVIRTNNSGSDIHRKIVKTIAMLNLFGRTLGMYATDAVLKAALDHIDENKISQCLDELRTGTRSIITFRKHLSAWAVFEGSDFDLESMLEEKRDALEFDDGWTKELDHRRFIIAKRHYHEKGTLRWLDQRIALSIGESDKERWKSRNDAFASFLLLANESEDNTENLLKFSKQNPHYVAGVCKDIAPLKSAARELCALKLIAQDTPELMHDPIAAKEYEVHKDNTLKELDAAYDKAFSNSVWWFYGQRIGSDSLNIIASQIADQMYPHTPKIFNELINRKRPSGTSNAARRKLMERMVEFSDQDNLGLDEGFPPEKAIYLSCLKQTGLHAAQKGGFGFKVPKQKGSESLRKMLEAAKEEINTASELVTLAKIYALWEDKPFGLTAGLSSVLALAYLLSRDEELAYYDKDSTGQYVFIPEIDDEFVNKMMRAPKEVAVRYFEVSGVKHHYIHTFAKVAGNKLEREISPQALSVARPIVTFIHQLPAWVKNARLADGPAKKFRDAVMKANDPYRLLLEDLYSVFGMDSAKSEEDSDKLLDNALNSAIDQLRSMHVEMLNGYKQILSAELGQLDSGLEERCERVQSVAADFRLQTFARRLRQCSSSDDRWLESLISLVASAPAKDWNDAALARGREELFEYCQRFKRVETFISAGVPDSNAGQSKSIALVVGSGQEAKAFSRQVSINEKQAQKVGELKSKLLQALKDDSADDLKALALQEALQDLLKSDDEVEPTSEQVCELEGT